MTRGRPFAPGQSGNPGGRPQSAEISALARRYVADALTALVKVTRLNPENPKYTSAVVAAANSLVDLGFPGCRRAPAETAALDALHLHLLAVKAVLPPSAETPEVAIPDNMLPIPDPQLPHEALPLWDLATKGNA